MTRRDLLRSDEESLSALRERIPLEGFCARLLACRNEDGHWGLHYYQPKWTCTHYTLAELKNLCMPRDHPVCREAVLRMFDECQLKSGALNLSKHDHPGDVCVDGMILDYASCFIPEDSRLDALCAHLLSVQKPDGGFSWDLSSGAGDPHTTVCVLEGMMQYAELRGASAAGGIGAAVRRAVEYLLENNLFCDDSDRRFRRLTYPHRYRYDLLRALVFFERFQLPYDSRMCAALDWLAEKRGRDGRWPLEYAHPGNVHFELEPLGEPSRLITLKALAIETYFSRAVERA
jgi:hypothetical protein